MGFISNLTPLNLQEEKIKFFCDYSYNPQFTYSRDFTYEELTRWGLPEERYIQILKKLITSHGSVEPKKYTITTPSQIEVKVKNVLNKLHIDKPLKIIFSELLISRCSIDSRRIIFRVPIEFSEEDFTGLMNHEIQTHLLRRINDEKQVWHMSPPNNLLLLKREFTEEGLANLHSFITSKEKYMTRSWINYCAILLSQHHSFSKTFLTLMNLGVDEKQAWFATVRAKRGLKDTSTKGGNTKGLTYLHGTIKVSKWLLDKNNNPRDMYAGRISIDEMRQKKSVVRTDAIIFPTFMRNIATYKQHIAEIVSKNKIDEMEI